MSYGYPEPRTCVNCGYDKGGVKRIDYLAGAKVPYIDLCWNCRSAFGKGIRHARVMAGAPDLDRVPPA